VPTEGDAVIAQLFPGGLPISDLFWHGTAVASIVASNAKVLAGVNRDVTLLAVKIWNRFSQGPISQMLAGIVYAADQGADVINVSGGYTRDKSENPGIMAAVNRAANYAFRKGALLISVAGNDAADLDHNDDTVRLPCEAANALCASATGPDSAKTINGEWYNVDARAPYSAFGRSAVDVAAPGGVAGRFRTVPLPCTTTPTAATNPLSGCRANPPSYVPFECRTNLDKCRIGAGVGTSLAAPTVAGLAALLVTQLGKGNPALIRSRILESADDLGELGTDPYYGKGRINVARALGVMR
jgi:subtilisin family serine protease